MAERIFGEIANQPPGSHYPDRREVAAAGVHRPLQAGICGGPDGAESIVVSGGYIDDQDYGDEIIYTGQGGRDPNSGAQIADQELTRGNLGLARDYLDDIPVRVVRGYQGEPAISPKTGYRYDGLFGVADYWQEAGKDGFQIWRFRLVAAEMHRPWVSRSERDTPTNNLRRRTIDTRQPLKNFALQQRVREIHDHTCQVCGLRLLTPAGPYAEAVHIREIAKPHNGSTTIDNLLCLCPNDAVRFSTGAIYVDQTWVIRQTGSATPLGELRRNKYHPIGPEHLRYHRQHHSGA
jgi:putative restriction endonuclease